MDDTKALTIGFCVLVITIGGCIAHMNVLDNKVIAAAKDPAVMACAIGSRESKNTPFCVAVANNIAIAAKEQK